MKVTVLSILAIFLLISCSKDDSYELTYELFKEKLTIDMNYDDIVKTFGKPSEDIGSGIHIYVYKLNDSTEVWIGYTDLIHYAYHVDQNGELLEVLLDITQ